MASNITNWSKIYETSFWGIGVINDIYWGIVYFNNKVKKDFINRVVEDGGVIESSMCINVIE